MDSWLPIVTFVLGQLFALALAYISNRWQHNRELVAREERRRDQQQLFQRDTLLELQDALLECERAFLRTHLERYAWAKEKGWDAEFASTEGFIQQREAGENGRAR
jgi:hypothetical protein